MKASVTSTERLKLRKRAGSRLASMKASMSGMIDAQAAHHRPATLPGRLDGSAHGIPAVHEAERP